MSRHAYNIRADKPLPGAWLAVLEALMEAGTASTAELQEACAHYAPTTITSVASGMHQFGFLQYAPGKQWGLTTAGIEAALQAEAAPKFDAAAKTEIKPKSQAVLEANAKRQRTKKRLREQAAHTGAMRRQGEVMA